MAGVVCSPREEWLWRPGQLLTSLSQPEYTEFPAPGASGCKGAAQGSCHCGDHPPTAGLSCERRRAMRRKPCFSPGKQPPLRALPERAHRALCPAPPSPHASQPLLDSSGAPNSPGQALQRCLGSAGAAADLFSNLWEFLQEMSLQGGCAEGWTTTVGATAYSAFWGHTKGAAALPSAPGLAPSLANPEHPYLHTPKRGFLQQM